MADHRETRPYYYKLERQRFACITYAVTAVFLILALLQWYLFHLLGATNKYFTSNYWVGIIFFVLSLVLIMLFIFFEDLRFFTPINWILAFIIFECVVVGVTSLVVRHYQYHLLVSFLIWTVVLVIFLVLGSFIPFIMYHAQIINGGRFAEIRDKDYLLAALILFYDFLLMYLFTFQLAPKWSDVCDTHRNSTNIFVVDQHLKRTTAQAKMVIADAIQVDVEA
ncbi:uncharacterized protein LOC115758196 isoform X2 [Drosophila novamexicana]|uniref:uncharacterized protein LOC115758196 isoform X2 n=1 Tax=Drosophila novamexicana TaxID=47314 RepID=UPI0011E5BE38|nr:uncharacterized protein LOC115758196 isoform X2 [Drosophila novamexicana]